MNFKQTTNYNVIDSEIISEIRKNDVDQFTCGAILQEVTYERSCSECIPSHYIDIENKQPKFRQNEVPINEKDENNNVIKAETLWVFQPDKQFNKDYIKHFEETSISIECNSDCKHGTNKGVVIVDVTSSTQGDSENKCEIDDTITETSDSELRTDLKFQVCLKEDNLISSLPVPKPPPGFQIDEDLQRFCFLEQSQTEGGQSYVGSKYGLDLLALLSLPASQTELVAGGRLRIARPDYGRDFKLFNGGNFGDIELGVSSEGIAQAVRRFQKLNTMCNKYLVSRTQQLVEGMMEVGHEHILPYTGIYDTTANLLLAMPLCQMDLGQYIRLLRSDPANYTPASLLSLVKQMMKGLHYLHTLPNPITHGNLKPSNILIDGRGNLRLAEFGLHEVIFQQQRPSLTTMIWWARDTLDSYDITWKVVCSPLTDIQSAGMLVHFLLSLGQHPFGHGLPDIVRNISAGLATLGTCDVLAADLVGWMLSHDPSARPAARDVLRSLTKTVSFPHVRHVLFWSAERRWDFLVRCCGRDAPPDCPLAQVHADLDQLGRLRDINTKWVSALRRTCEKSFGATDFPDTPSGLLKFLGENLDSWRELQLVFLEVFPILPLNFMRLLEQTPWINHPHFQPFTLLSD